MKELDLTLAGIANANTRVGKNIIRGQQQQQNQEEIDRVLATIDDAKREKSLQRFYQNSIQDKNNSKRQPVHGKNYVGKTALYVSILIAGVIITPKVTEITSEISEYNRVLNQKLESELTDSEQNLYQEEHKNSILNAIDAYHQIQEGKDSLNSEDYNIFGENIQDATKEYLSFDGRSSFNLSEKSQDAIDVATDQVISEYQGKGR